MMKDLNIGGSSDVTMGPTSLPAKRAWTKVLFGPNVSMVNPQDNITTSQTISTITNTNNNMSSQKTMEASIIELKEETQSIVKKQGDELLDRVMNFNSKSDERTKTLEAMSNRSDTILQQLVTNQEKQSVDMDKQHGFIVNMDVNFSKTAAQVEKLQNIMTLNQEIQTAELGKQYGHIENMNKNFAKTAAQVDKLQNTMATFMRRITSSISTLTNNNNIHTKEDNMEDLFMDVESVVGNGEPPSADDISLRDGGSR